MFHIVFHFNGKIDSFVDFIHLFPIAYRCTPLANNLSTLILWPNFWNDTVHFIHFIRCTEPHYIISYSMRIRDFDTFSQCFAIERNDMMKKSLSNPRIRIHSSPFGRIVCIIFFVVTDHRCFVNYSAFKAFLSAALPFSFRLFDCWCCCFEEDWWNETMVCVSVQYIERIFFWHRSELVSRSWICMFVLYSVVVLSSFSWNFHSFYHWYWTIRLDLNGVAIIACGYDAIIDELISR